jgi:hypothetical protein
MRRRLWLLQLLAAGAVLAGCTSARTAAPMPAASAPGVTATSIQLASVLAESVPWDLGTQSFAGGVRAALAWANDHGGAAGRRIDYLVEAVAPTAEGAAAGTRYVLDTIGAFELVGSMAGPFTATVATTAARSGATSAFDARSGVWLPSLGAQLAELAARGELARHTVVWDPTSQSLPTGVTNATGATISALVATVRHVGAHELVLGDDLPEDAAALEALRHANEVPSTVVLAGSLTAPRREGAWLAAAAGLHGVRVMVVDGVPSLSELPHSWQGLVARLEASVGASNATLDGVLVGLDAIAALRALGPAPTRVAFARAVRTAVAGPPGRGIVVPVGLGAPVRLVHVA